VHAFVLSAAEAGRAAVTTRVFRAIRLVDRIPGWTECCLAGLTIALDAVTSRPGDADSSLINQIRAAAVAQGLLPQAQAGGYAALHAQAAVAPQAGQQAALAFAGQQGAGLMMGAPPQLAAPQVLAPQLLQHQLLPPQVMQPQLLQPQYVLPQYGQAAPPQAPAGQQDLCWRCGVLGHRTPTCSQPINPVNPYPFRPVGRGGRR
jgi:hypothetical protein